MLIYFFKWTWRELIKTLKPLFFNWLVNEIIKENYVTKIYFDWKKIKKENLKKITLISNKENELKKFLDNNNLFIKW